MTALLLGRGLQLLAVRVTALEDRVRAGDENAWPPYLAALQALAALDRPARGGSLTTADMADRLGITPKSLLRRVKRGDVVPALRAGKLIRWRGDEAVTASPGQQPTQSPRGVTRTVARRVATEGA